MIRIAWLLMLVLIVILAGCGEGFPDQEAHLGLQDKIRPYEMNLMPPEASPGELVHAELHYHMPRAAAAAAAWQVALDFDLGLYGADEVERELVDITSLGQPRVDEHGFVTQSATFRVPDEIFAVTSAIPDVLVDPAMLAALALLPDAQVSDPPRKDEVAAFLAGLTATSIRQLPREQALAAFYLADLFACAVRYRVTLTDGDQEVAITRRLTVRHSRRLESLNENENTWIISLQVGEIPRADFDLGDLADVLGEVVYHPLVLDGMSDIPVVLVPFDPGHTYFMSVDYDLQRFTSPFDPALSLVEQGYRRWYYYRSDNPDTDHQFLVTDEGDEAEMYQLEDEVRLAPPGVGAEYRVLVVARDERAEWAAYHASPGSAVGEVLLRFVAP